MLRRLLILSLALAPAAGVRAVELSLDPRALAAAIDIGQSRLESIRTHFHQPYRIPLARAPVDYIDIVTPFRRVVLAAETRARVGDRLYGQREAMATLHAAPQQIDLVVELTFHPQNTYLGVPPYDVRLLAAGARGVPAVEPLAIHRVPRFGARIAGMPLPYPFPLTAPTAPGAQPLAGGMLIAAIDGAMLARGVYEVLVVDDGRELARARVDFGSLR